MARTTLAMPMSIDDYERAVQQHLDQVKTQKSSQRLILMPPSSSPNPVWGKPQNQQHVDRLQMDKWRLEEQIRLLQAGLVAREELIKLLHTHMPQSEYVQLSSTLSDTTASTSVNVLTADRVHDEAMKPNMKALKALLKDTFNETFVITDFDPDKQFMALTWEPDEGPNEYGFYDHNDPVRRHIIVYHSQPASFSAWTKIFRVLGLFFDNKQSAMHLIRFTEWVGTIEDLFAHYPDLQVRFDQLESKWNARHINVSEHGPALFNRFNDDILTAATDVVTDNLLFQEWEDERKSVGNFDPSIDVTLDQFLDWKQYKCNTSE